MAVRLQPELPAERTADDAVSDLFADKLLELFDVEGLRVSMPRRRVPLHQLQEVVTVSRENLVVVVDDDRGHASRFCTVDFVLADHLFGVLAGVAVAVVDSSGDFVGRTAAIGFQMFSDVVFDRHCSRSSYVS